MRILIPLIFSFFLMGCGSPQDEPHNFYLEVLEEYFYSEYLKINDCYQCSGNTSFSDSSFIWNFTLDGDPFQEPKGYLDSEYIYPNLLLSDSWNEIFPSYSRFYFCRSLSMMSKNSWFVLLRKGASMKLNDSVGVFFEVPDLFGEFESQASEAIELFFGGNVNLVEPRGDILNSGIINSFKNIDFEENVLSGESTLSKTISPDKSIIIIEYNSALFNKENDKAVLFIRRSIDGNWYNHLIFFEKIATRWNVLFKITGS